MNEKELLKLLSVAKTQYEYDHLIDKHVFKINKENRNTKTKRIHNVLTADQMLLKQRKELSTNLDYL